MKEVLFRGKRVDTGEWVYGYYVKLYDARHNRTVHCIYMGYAESDCEELFPDWYEVIPETVGQYTMLKDRNDKRVFEQDICKFREWDNGLMCWVGRISYEHCQYVISGGPNKECPSDFYFPLSRIPSEDIEIIGNIHDTKKGEELS